MDYNILMIAFGSGVVILTLIYIIKNGDSNHDEIIIQTPILNETNYQKSIGEKEYQDIRYLLENLNDEVKDMKKELQNLFHLMELRNLKTQITSIEKAEIGATENRKDDHFSHLLNYNLFTQKNNDIIELYQSGMSPEEIAKNLNKSVREVEMVIKLIK